MATVRLYSTHPLFEVNFEASLIILSAFLINIKTRHPYEQTTPSAYPTLSQPIKV